MSIPSLEEILHPVLKVCEDHKLHSLNEIIYLTYKRLDLNEEELNRKLPHKKGNILDCRVTWAVFILEKAGLLDRYEGRIYRISRTGLSALNKASDIFDFDYLENFLPFYLFVEDTAQMAQVGNAFGEQHPGASPETTDEEVSEPSGDSDTIELDPKLEGERKRRERIRNQKRDLYLSAAVSRCLRLLGTGETSQVVGIFYDKSLASDLSYDPFAKLRDEYSGKEALTLQDIERWIEEGLIKEAEDNHQEKKEEALMRRMELQNRLKEATEKRQRQERHQKMFEEKKKKMEENNKKGMSAADHYRHLSK